MLKPFSRKLLSCTLIAATISSSASSAFAHGFWIFPQPSPQQANRIVATYADGPEPGTGSTLDANAEFKIFHVQAKERKDVEMVRLVSGEVAILAGALETPEIKELEAYYIPPVRGAGRGGLGGERGEGARAGGPAARTEGAAPAAASGTATTTSAAGGEGAPRMEGRGGRGGRGEGMMGRGGQSFSGQAAGQFEFYGKYCLLSPGETLKSKGNDAMKVDFLPKWNGNTLTVLVLDRGQPAEQCRVTLAGPDQRNDRGETEFGDVQFEDVVPGQYHLEVQLTETIPATDSTSSPTRMTRVGTLILELKK